MKKVRTLRTICVTALALILLFVSLFILIPRRGDAKSGRAAVCFVHEDLLFPQMDMSQLFSQLDIASYYVIDDDVTEAEMEQTVDKILSRKKIDSVVLVCEGNYAMPGLSISSRKALVTDLILLSPELPSASDLEAATKKASSKNANSASSGASSKGDAAKAGSSKNDASSSKANSAAVFGELGAQTPACRVAIFSESGAASDTLYERLSGEDTKLARGVKADASAPELYISADATRYYARMGSYSDPEVASVITMNSPVMQTYLANYLKNHTLGEKGISRAPLWTWVAKTVCTVITVIAFFLYAATLPASKKFVPSKSAQSAHSEAVPAKSAHSEASPAKDPRGGAPAPASAKPSASESEPAKSPFVKSNTEASASAPTKSASAASAPDDDPDLFRPAPEPAPAPKLERDRKGKLRARSIAEKYRSSLNHLLALQLFIGALFALPAMFFVARKNTAYRVVLLVWICFSLLSSAFYLLSYIRKIKGRKVRRSRSMWLIHMLFTILLGADIFMLTLLWKGAGFLALDLLLLVAIVLSVLLGVAMGMLQLSDNFFGKIQGSTQSVLDSVKFSAIRFVPMVIVFTFSIIIGRELYAVQVFLLAISLLGASYLRRVVRKGAFGEVLSVILFSALYWMMF